MKVCTTCGKEYADDQSFCPADGSALRSASGSNDLVGNIVADRYRIIKKLGEGGMGAVYLGEHVKMGRKSAIKVISSSMADDADSIARFNREAANAARINHHNVCGIYDFGETPDGVVYLAMEFIEGEALTDLIEREGALSPRRAGLILRQAAEALAAAHELGIVHRDLKPDNIMIAKGRDGSDLVKVVDFGIAKAMGGDQDQQVTKTGLVVGTPEYMSPEQLAGDQVDGRSDIFSLALVLFRMLTGVLPFQADTAQEVMIKRLTDDPLRLNEARPGGNFPPALQQAMDRALEKMPNDRYAEASQFGRDVEAAVSAMADVAPAFDTDGATQLIDSTAVSAADATAVLPETLIGEQAQSKRAPASVTPDTAVAAVSPPKEPAAKKRSPVMAVVATVIVLGVGGGGAFMMMGNPDPNQTNEGAQDSTEIAQNAADQRQDANTQTASNPAATSVTPPTTSNTPSVPPVSDPVPVPDPPVANTRPGWVSLENAQTHIDDMIFALFDASSSQASAIRDSARVYFDIQQLPTSVRASAAFAVANAYSVMDDRTTALTWARRALNLDPGKAAYQRLVDDLERGGDA
ncbi:MAG: serine/threonine protein kinase [Gemmatimonadota bacterium]|nr:serine/threonine protein kinase [Gemmatimonadota bacterium]